MPYSDNPNISTGYRDAPPSSSTNPFNDDDEEVHNSIANHHGAPYRDITPPSSLFSFVQDLNAASGISNINSRTPNGSPNGSRPTSPAMSEAEEYLGALEQGNDFTTNTSFLDRSDSSTTGGGCPNGTGGDNFIWHLTPGKAGKEVESVWADRFTPSNKDERAHPIKNTIKMALLGFSMGIIVMLIGILVTNNGRPNSDNRVGAPANGNGASTDGGSGTLLDGFDPSIDTNTPDSGAPESTNLVDHGQEDPDTIAEYNAADDEDHPQAEVSSAKDKDESKLVDNTNNDKNDSAADAANDVGDANVNDGDDKEDSSTPAKDGDEANDKNENKANTDSTVSEALHSTTDLAPPPPVPDIKEDSIPIHQEAKQEEEEHNAEKYTGHRDVSKFCDGCRWKNSHYSCIQRADYMAKRFVEVKNLNQAKQNLLDKGHCPGPENEAHSEINQHNWLDSKGNTLPNETSCRKRPQPGIANTPENFCVWCEWKGSEYHCLKRALYLRDMHNLSLENAMINLMKEGKCKDERTEKEMATLREQGLEYWNAWGMYGGYTCFHRIKTLMWNPEACHSAKHDLMDSFGLCKLPPYCDEEKKDSP